MKETDLYEPVKKWLEKRNYEVYPEIQVFSYSSVADIVGEVAWRCSLCIRVCAGTEKQ